MSAVAELPLDLDAFEGPFDLLLTLVLKDFHHACAGPVAAMGGRPVEDLLAEVQGADWKRITREFFLTSEKAL